MRILILLLRYISSLIFTFIAINAQDFDLNQKYIIENQFNGQILGQYTSNPPQLAPRILTNDKEIYIFTKEENGKKYYSFVSPYGMQGSDPQKYKRFASPEQEDEELTLKENGSIWWEIIPHISKDGHNYGYVYFKNVQTGLYMKDNTSIDNSLNLRSPERSSSGAFVTATKLDNPDDRRFLWQITPLITTPPSKALTLPQSGWTPKANKIAVLTSKDQINPPTFRVFTKDGQLLFKSRAVYWGRYWDNLHFYTLNLNNKKLEIEGTYKVEAEGITKTIYIKDDIYLHPMREKGSDRFSVKEIFSPDFGFVTQWGRLVNWWPKPYEFLNSLTSWDPFDTKSPYNFPDWMWRDDSDANGNGQYYEPYGGTATVDEVNNCYKGGWDMTDQYAHNYALDGLILAELSQMYQNANSDELRDRIYKEILYGVDGLLKRQESDGSWRQGFMDKLKWTGTNAGLGAGLASTLPIIKAKDASLAGKVQNAIEKSWNYVKTRANDSTTWAVPNEGKLPDGSTVKGMLPTQRNLFRESYLHFAINRYINTKDSSLKKLIEDEIKKGTIYNSSWCRRGGGSKLAGQFTAHGEWALVALLKYYKFASDDVKRDIESIADSYYNDYIIKKEHIGGPYGAYGRYLAQNGTAYTWQVWKNMMCATLIYQTFGQKYGQGIVLTQKALDWYWGSNPYDSSLIFGVGDFYVNSGWASYHTIGRHIGVERVDKTMHLKGSDGGWASSETSVMGSIAVWNSIILLDKYRNSLKNVEIFTGENYGGDRVALPAGKYNDDLLKAYGMNLNDISSAKIPDGFTVKFYTGKSFNGTMEEVSDDISSLSDTNNRVNSVEIIYEGRMEAPAGQSSHDSNQNSNSGNNNANSGNTQNNGTTQTKKDNNKPQDNTKKDNQTPPTPTKKPDSTIDNTQKDAKDRVKDGKKSIEDKKEQIKEQTKGKNPKDDIDNDPEDMTSTLPKAPTEDTVKKDEQDPTKSTQDEKQDSDTKTTWQNGKNRKSGDGNKKGKTTVSAGFSGVFSSIFGLIFVLFGVIGASNKKEE